MTDCKPHTPPSLPEAFAITAEEMQEAIAKAYGLALDILAKQRPFPDGQGLQLLAVLRAAEKSSFDLDDDLVVAKGLRELTATLNSAERKLKEQPHPAGFYADHLRAGLPMQEKMYRAIFKFAEPTEPPCIS